jgi:hypothetical protein
MKTDTAKTAWGRRAAGAGAALLALAALAGCTGLDQIIPTSRMHNVALQKGDLEKHGLGMLTPSTVTGQEEDRQAVALVFSGVIEERRPKIRLVPLADTLGEINRAGLAEEYRRMVEDFRYTGVFRQETLKKVGELAKARYLAQLKMADFRQDSSSRLSIFGLRLIQTKTGNIRLFLTIWDTSDGSIAWEGMQELSYAYDTFREKPISFKEAVAEASKELAKEIP